MHAFRDIPHELAEIYSLLEFKGILSKVHVHVGHEISGN